MKFSDTVVNPFSFHNHKQLAVAQNNQNNDAILLMTIFSAQNSSSILVTHCCHTLIPFDLLLAIK
jgi:hypothetical protein